MPSNNEAGLSVLHAGPVHRLNAHVLVVEHDLASGRTLESDLIAAGHRVTLATNSSDAQRLVADDPPDLVLSDVGLPDLDGIALTRWLRENVQSATLPIVLVSSHDDSRILAQGMEAGADDCLVQPVDSLELCTRVRSLLRSKYLTDEFRAREQAAASFAARPTVTRGGPVPWGPRIHRGHGPSDPTQAEIDDEARPHTILVVGDSELARRLPQDVLQELHCEIRTAPGGSCLLQTLTQDPLIDLVMLELIPADMDSHERIRQVKANPELAHIPLLAVALQGDVSGRVSALQGGADDFITTEFDVHEFKARVQRLLRLKRSFDQLSSRCARAMQQAVTDSLTGLFTHGFLQELLHQEVPRARRYGQPLSLVFGDIDHFKQMNDRHGHAFGDQVIKAVARALRDSVRVSDTVVRYGGEEFVILLPHTERVEAHRLAERIRAKVEALTIDRPNAADQAGEHVTISLGVAGFPQDATDADSLIHHADEAMYNAKLAGRNRVAVFGQSQTGTTGQPRVLIVDDSSTDRLMLEYYLGPEGYELLKACDGEEAVEIVRRSRPDLIVLDGVMPHLDGFDVCRRLKHDGATCLIPVILVTGLDSPAHKLRGIEAGADDFLTKPVNKAELLARVRSLLRSKRTTDLLEDAETVIFTLARAVEARDPSTGGHVERVSHYAVQLGKALGLGDAQVEGLRRAGVVHDIGKVTVPDAVLLKPGKLTPEERKIIERHVEAGYELLLPLRTFAESLPAVRSHHERLDGSGYPQGLRGEQVPIVAQIMAIVDVFDALATDRIYRKAYPKEQAFAILRQEAGRGLHSPELVETFFRLVENGL